MMIKETIERECCDERKGDLKPYKGKQHCASKVVRFCKHCGQLWVLDSRGDAAGGTEKYEKPLIII